MSAALIQVLLARLSLQRVCLRVFFLFRGIFRCGTAIVADVGREVAVWACAAACGRGKTPPPLRGVLGLEVVPCAG